MKIKCPICKEEMTEYWTVEFDFYPEFDSEDDRWAKIKNNVKESGFECFDCNLKIKNEDKNEN